MTMPDPFEEVIAKRLARLSHMPMDTTQLERAVRDEIPSPVTAGATRWRQTFRPIAAIAASLIVIALVALALQNRSVQASPDAMVQMHRDIVAGKFETMKVNSIDEANQAIAAFAGSFPKLPQPPETHTMACCMRNVGDKKVACVLLNNGGTPVTMAVADTDAVETSSLPTVQHNGQTFHVATIGELTMVMFDRQHHHVCLIGALPQEKLLALTDSLKF